MNEVMLNKKRDSAIGIMTLILSSLAIFAAVMGVFNEKLYDELFQTGVLSSALVTGSIAQDIISLPLGIILLVLSVFFLKRQGLKTFIVIMGLAWYFFYAFGLYVIQGNYTSIYLIYLAILGLSIYSMIWGLASFSRLFSEKIELPKPIRISIAVFLLLILFILVPGWLLRISPDIAKHIPGATYGVYILDLCLVFPAFAQISIMLFKEKVFANVLAGIALIKIFTLCLSWGFGEWYTAMSRGVQVQYDMTFLSSGLTLIGLLLLIPYFTRLKRSDL